MKGFVGAAESMN